MILKTLTIAFAFFHVYCYFAHQDTIADGRHQMRKRTFGNIYQMDQKTSTKYFKIQRSKRKITRMEGKSKRKCNTILRVLCLELDRYSYTSVGRKKNFKEQKPEKYIDGEKSKSYVLHQIKALNDSLKNVEALHFKPNAILGSRIQNRKRRNVILVPDIKNCSSSRVSCEGRCLNKRDAGGIQKLRCSCDPYCDYFKDCCADYVQYCLGQPSTNTTETVTIKVPDEQWTCRSGIWMIASCPLSWTNQDINKSCISRRSMSADNYKDVIPVITADNKTYANRFCAQCHGKNFKNVVELVKEIKFKCLMAPPNQVSKQEKMEFLFRFCKKHSLNFNEELPRRICFDSEAKCSSNQTTTKKAQAKCLDGHYGLVHEASTKRIFKNVYCGLCNNMTKMECGPTIKPEKKNKFKPSTLSFSIIMDIGGKSSKVPQVSGISSCPKEHVYDVYLETCRQGQKLVPVVSDLKLYSITLWIKKAVNNGTFPNRTKFSKSFAAAFGFNSTRISSLEIEFIEPDYYLYKVEFNIDLTNYTDKQFKISRNITFLFETFKPFHLQIGESTFTVIKVTTKPMTCAQTDTFSPHEYQVIPAKLGSVYINTTGEILGIRDYYPTTGLTLVNGTQVPLGEIVVCRQMLSVYCSGTYIFLHKHEYVIFSNRSVLYNASGHLYEYGTYMWKNRTVMICTNFTASYTQFQSNTNTNDDNVLTILTYIGFSISVVCLLFVLVTYSVFANLRTIPGVNLMNLCSALLVAQLLWLVGSGLTFAGPGCMVIAMVLHYSFLASFWWMSIIAFNTWRAFSGKGCTRRNRMDKGQRRKHIIRTMTVGWLPLVMYVAICVTLDTSGTVAIGYGGDKGCWINNSRANLYFFAIPVGLSLFWNAVYFVLIIKEIKKAIDQSQMVASQHQARKDSKVYARIAVLMGFTWVFGFVVPFTSYYLMYPFVILNTLQGLYIAVAFGFTRRVQVLYKNFGNNRKKATSSKKQPRSVEGTHKTKV